MRFVYSSGLSPDLPGSQLSVHLPITGTQQQRAVAKALPSAWSYGTEQLWVLDKDHNWSNTEMLVCENFHWVWFALNHCTLVILFIHTQVPLGYLWNYLLIPKVLCILAWIIVYLKISTEVYYSLFTTGSKTHNYVCAGVNNQSLSPLKQQHRFRKFSTLTMVCLFSREKGASHQSGLFCGTIC